MRIAIIDLNSVARNWPAIALRGVVAVLFGIVAFVSPVATAAVLVLAIGAYLLADGVLHIVAAFRSRGTNMPVWALALQGVCGIAAGLLTLFWPGITALALLYLIAAWAIVIGIFEMVAAVRLRRVIEGEWLLGLAGLLSVVLGVALALFPGPGALALVFWLGAYAVVTGVLLLVLAFRMRSWARAHEVPVTRTDEALGGGPHAPQPQTR
ncbi:MAG TPA: HdeD family acid-resistance protein [Polyangiales bacterium]|nr:HdeD family acid-resistance protein [Polyangiales bacterium]